MPGVPRPLLLGLLLGAAGGTACGHDWSSTTGDADDGSSASDDVVLPPDAEDGDADSPAETDAGPVACRNTFDCGARPCVDGFCCDRECADNCEACDLAGREGWCTPVAAGTDPDNECSAESASTCGQDGTCDGRGGCARYGADTPCDDGLWCTIADACDGAGGCAGGPVACDPGSGNECCTGRCDEAAPGCVTEPTECPDACGPSELVVGRSCAGCGPAHAAGVCGGGTVHSCDDDSHALCATAECGGALLHCTNAGGGWAWRTDPSCDDEIDCTTGDSCSGSGVCAGAAEAGAQAFEAPGESSFTVPCFHALTVVVRGGGGGGGSSYYNRSGSGTAGGASVFQSVRAEGGGPGRGSSGGLTCPSGADGAGGTASGGTTNITGEPGRAGNGGAGGGPGGGAGGTVAAESPGSPGTAPGGGGAGGFHLNCGGGGGGGGYSTRTYAPGELTVGSELAVTVGGGGVGGVGGSGSAPGGAGALGAVAIDWD